MPSYVNGYSNVYDLHQLCHIGETYCTEVLLDGVPIHVRGEKIAPDEASHITRPSPMLS
ncbi:MAG: hypothetical protein AAGC93_12800 [Cyanobacteria bacterium P01_F01_bin.53]